jgi:cytochrome c-type biogenesis protein CcmF
LYPASRQIDVRGGALRGRTGRPYLVLGERRAGPDGQAAGWSLRAFHNPFAKLIFIGTLLIALGGLVSLSDRRLRIAAARRRVPASTPALEAAE